MEATSVEEVTINGKPGGEAEFTIIAEGATATVPVKVKMVRDASGWRITHALVGGESLKLIHD
ncbi:hypothetical protein [Piscinibacter sp. XHJ-5]|uniref:hypothetical protein n=1 Tax=Piscinibacter sp. XHJ-5 TaxID=3037797 RepID=UPI0024536447|nr:hypothetical protein [Piscinibacter sp. XHJ-5]